METPTSKVNKTVRPPAVAGSFYPDDQDALIRMIDRMLGTAQRKQTENRELQGLKALIVPHAGYRYSGEVAAAAYALMSKVRDRISRVVLMGPAHRVRVHGLAISGADYFATPLGSIPIDIESVELCLEKIGHVSISNKAHQQEHSLETQLPFLQRCLGRFSLVPVLVGLARPEEVAECLELMWGGDETIILISSDLSHFLSYKEARRIDGFTCSAILNLEPDAIGYDHACGQIGVRALLQLANRKDMEVSQLDARNSGDTAGRKDQVVGYGSFAFYDA